MITFVFKNKKTDEILKLSILVLVEALVLPTCFNCNSSAFSLFNH